ncbi:DNA-binding response regulator [Bacteroidetes/Chlorobi group bacterium Naka2016]|jgi:DNA-binding NarL/FixJ family response regulator|nr:MAG: DNA-binding response regulator [Bacteroidetes/Chlorobi group bacterium Naka2016]
MESSKTYTVLVADDFPLVRLGIKAYLMSQPEFKIVGEASNGVEALELIDTLSPDIAVVDIVMPFLDGISVAEHLKQNDYNTKVLLVTAVEEFVDLRLAFYSGADGILLKNVSQSSFIDSIHSILNGKKVYCKAIFELLFNPNRFVDKNYHTLKFTKLQQKIISRRLRGYLFPEIAEELNLTIPQVAQELSNIIEIFEETEYVIHSIVT